MLPLFFFRFPPLDLGRGWVKWASLASYLTSYLTSSAKNPPNFTNNHPFFLPLKKVGIDLGGFLSNALHATTPAIFKVVWDTWGGPAWWTIVREAPGHPNCCLSLLLLLDDGQSFMCRFQTFACRARRDIVVPVSIGFSILFKRPASWPLKAHAQIGREPRQAAVQARTRHPAGRLLPLSSSA